MSTPFSGSPIPSRATHPRVCVIGAGVSGIACVKKLAELGIEVDAYEMMPIMGGVFGSSSWKGGQLTSSTIFTWFSQYPAADRQRFFTWEEFLEYVQSYVAHFKIAESIHLNCRVLLPSKNGAHYRLVGPGSDWQEAAQIIKQTPQFRNWPNAILRWCVLSLLTVVSLLCSPFRQQFRLIKNQSGT